jgi:hypothetical protein
MLPGLSYLPARVKFMFDTLQPGPGPGAIASEIAGPMTGNQLERFARAHRQVSAADDAAARIRRRLTWRFEEDGSLTGTFRLPPLAGAVLLKALRAAAADLEHPHDGHEPDVSAETPSPVPAPRVAPAPSARADHPADPARCHVEDGPAISVTTAQMIACSSSISWMLHDSAGKLLDLGRRRRRPNAALRRAARERDKCRCRFPGCESRRVDLHHIQYWSYGGRTSLDNLVSLCKYHHQLVHDRGYLIAAVRDGTFAFYRPDGTAIPAGPPLPPADGMIGGCHDADITPETIIPPWYGERLDLDHAIYVCLANAASQASQTDQASQPGSGPPPVSPGHPNDHAANRHEPTPPHPWGIEPQDWMPSLRHGYATA